MAMSKAHAEERLDGFLSAFGPWDLALYAPGALAFSVVLDGAKGNLAAVELVRSSSPPKGAVLDDRFPGYIPFVTHIAVNWGALRKIAAEILGVPRKAIAFGVDAKGTAVLIHVFGFSDEERKAIGRERMLATAPELPGGGGTRKNPDGGGRGRKKGHGPIRHSDEYLRIMDANPAHKDWLMRGAPRDPKAIVARTMALQAPNKMPVTYVAASDQGGLQNLIGNVVALYPGRRLGLATDLEMVATWREMLWSELYGQHPFSPDLDAGQLMIEALMPGRGMNWDERDDRRTLWETYAIPERRLPEFPADRYTDHVLWLYDTRRKKLEGLWTATAILSMEKQARKVDRESQGRHLDLGLPYVRAHLLALVQALKIPDDAEWLLDGWDVREPSTNQRIRLKVGDVLKGLSQSPPQIVYQPVPEARIPRRALPAGGTIGSEDPLSRPPADAARLRDAVKKTGASEIVDPVETAGRLLKDELRPEDFVLGDYVDRDPHFVTVRADQPDLAKGFAGSLQKALQSRARRQPAIRISPRFPKWAAGVVFQDWHRRNEVQRRRLMQVWLMLDERKRLLNRVRAEERQRVEVYRAIVKDTAVPTQNDIQALAAKEMILGGLTEGSKGLDKLTDRVRKRLADLGVDWAADPGALPATDDADMARKWLEDEEWRETSRVSFREGRMSVADVAGDAWAHAKRAWSEARRGPLRHLRDAVGRWSAKVRLSSLKQYKDVLSQRTQGLLRDAMKRSGWSAIGEDIRHMKLWAIASWTDLTDVTKFAGGIIKSPAESLRGSLGVPALQVHDWLEKKVLPGFDISVRKLARKKKWSRAKDVETGRSVFTDEAGEKVGAPRMTRKKRRTRVTRRQQVLDALQEAITRWRDARARKDREGRQQAARARREVERLRKEAEDLGHSGPFPGM